MVDYKHFCCIFISASIAWISRHMKILRSSMTNWRVQWRKRVALPWSDTREYYHSKTSMRHPPLLSATHIPQLSVTSTPTDVGDSYTVAISDPHAIDVSDCTPQMSVTPTPQMSVTPHTADVSDPPPDVCDSHTIAISDPCANIQWSPYHSCQWPPHCSNRAVSDPTCQLLVPHITINFVSHPNITTIQLSSDPQQPSMTPNHSPSPVSHLGLMILINKLTIMC